jgi:hypothetical protein
MFSSRRGSRFWSCSKITSPVSYLSWSMKGTFLNSFLDTLACCNYIRQFVLKYKCLRETTSSIDGIFLWHQLILVRTQNTEHRTQNTEHRTQNTEHRTQNTEHRTQNTEHKTQNTKHKRVWTIQFCCSSNSICAIKKSRIQWSDNFNTRTLDSGELKS